jgi:hypothetical protein
MDSSLPDFCTTASSYEGRQQSNITAKGKTWRNEDRRSWMPTARPTGRSPTISWWEQQRVGPKVIDETVRVTKRFLEEHPEEIAKVSPTGETGKKLGAIIISRFLGWNETRVHYSLERLKLIDKGILDKEAIESMPSDNAARDLVDGDYKRICVSMGMERKVEGCHIDGVISWSTAVQLFPAAASPFSARSSPPSAPTGILRRDACKRTSTTAISPPVRPPIIPPRRPWKIPKTPVAQIGEVHGTNHPPPHRDPGHGGGSQERILFPGLGMDHKVPDFWSEVSWTRWIFVSCSQVSDWQRIIHAVSSPVRQPPELPPRRYAPPCSGRPRSGEGPAAFIAGLPQRDNSRTLAGYGCGMEHDPRRRAG